jgi:hypothetical protein
MIVRASGKAWGGGLWDAHLFREAFLATVFSSGDLGLPREPATAASLALLACPPPAHLDFRPRAPAARVVRHEWHHSSPRLDSRRGSTRRCLGLARFLGLLLGRPL